MDEYTIEEMKYKNGFADGYQKGLQEAVKHGRWNRVEAALGGGIKTHRFACSECGFLKNTLIGNYCPNCGARMDGGERRAEP